MANWGRISSRGNVEDRRSFAPVAIGGLGLGGLAVYLLVTYLTGAQVDVGTVLSQLENVQVQQQPVDTSQFEGQDSYEVFASTVLGSNNDMWKQVFNKSNADYKEPRLVLFRMATESDCGTATSDVGPHYCPPDETIYLDETFFDELKNRFGAKGGDVAEAYVISHEAGHHAQNMLGISDQVQSQMQSDPNSANDLSVRLELQADCFAGLWANSIRDAGVFEPGEIAEAMDAASAVGDDRIQVSEYGHVNPETWTHGSSEERVGWFNKGYESGNLEACDTFK